MIEMELEVNMNARGPLTAAGSVMPTLEVGPLDDLYYRFVTTDGTAPTTGELKWVSRRTINEEPLEEAALALDGTKQTLEIDGVNYLTFAVTTPESGRTGRLHIFARRTQE